jgi:chromosome segregation ATPase
MVGMFDRFKKNEGEGGGEMVLDDSQGSFESTKPEPEQKVEPALEPESSPQMTETQSFEPQTTGSVSSSIGIDGLMDKRVKLEEAIDFVGVIIKNLKEKRTKLEKDIEEESVDIKNLKEKLVKVREYIDEENKGIEDITNKRSQVEREADGVGNMINELKNKLSGIDRVIDNEGKKIQSFKDSRPK